MFGTDDLTTSTYDEAEIEALVEAVHHYRDLPGFTWEEYASDETASKILRWRAGVLRDKKRRLWVYVEETYSSNAVRTYTTWKDALLEFGACVEELTNVDEED